MTIDGTNWTVCTRAMDELSDPVTIYPLVNLPVIKNLITDQTQLFAQHVLTEPLLKTETPAPEHERLQSVAQRTALDGYYEYIMCFCCTSGCPSH